MSSVTIGRLTGGLLLVQLGLLAAGFMLLMPGTGSDFLTVDAAMEGRIRIAVLLLFANGAFTLVTALAAYPALREYGVRMAVAVVASAVVWVVMQSVDNAHVISMLSLSKRYVASAGANADLYDLIGAQARSTRGAIHYTTLLAIDVWFAVFYGALFAFRMVPRSLGAVALLGVALHLIGIPLSLFIGYPVIWTLAYGLLVSFVLVGGWLLFRGFPARQTQTGSS